MATAKLTVVYWRDIPTQVTAKKGRQRHGVQLGMRFQEAVDEAAMQAGKFTTDDYLEDWHQEHRDCSDDLEAEASAVAAELEAAFSDEDLKQLIKSKGLLTPTPS